MRIANQIIISGVDGAGKTTQAIMLHRYLCSCRKLDAFLYHYEMNEFFKMGISFLARSKESAKSCINYRTARERVIYDSIYRKILWTIAYAIDDLFHFVRLWFLSMLHQVIVVDRHPSIDGLAFRLYKKTFIKAWSNTLRYFIPRGSVILLLDIDTRVAHQRRPEHSSFELNFYRYAIKHIAMQFSNMTNAQLFTINCSDKSPSDIHKSIRSAVDILFGITRSTSV